MCRSWTLAPLSLILSLPTPFKYFQVLQLLLFYNQSINLIHSEAQDLFQTHLKMTLFISPPLADDLLMLESLKVQFSICMSSLL